MSRADTVAQATWRVRFRRRSSGVITHESSFRTEQAALDYFAALQIPDGKKTLEVRGAGKNRYAIVRSENIP
jgi:hypothetical protein